MTRALLPAVGRLLADPRPDAALVADFLRDADHGAFAELVRRHGPLVLGVCRRTLGHAADADDAFQATFLVLVRRARRVAWRGSLGPWLYGVAVRVARKARAARARRAAVERRAAMSTEPTTMPPEPDDAAAILDEELAALPEAVRGPLVLCELQGLSRRDAARRLGLAEGTLSSRLARGRKLLRDRLARRGVMPLAGGLCVAVPAGLASATAGRAVAVLAGAAGAVPAGIEFLTDGVVKAMAVSTWKLAAVAAAAAVGLTGFGAWRSGEPRAVAADPPPVPKAVATVGGQPVSKEEYADFLIRRHGEEEFQQFVTHRVIARAFAAEGLSLKPGEVAALLDTPGDTGMPAGWHAVCGLAPMHLPTRAPWVREVAAHYLMLRKLAEARIPPPTEAELRAAFARTHGPQVVCWWVVWFEDTPAEIREKVAAALRAGQDLRRAVSAGTLPNGRSPINYSDRHEYPRAGYELAVMWTPGGRTVHEVAAKLKVGEVTDVFEADGRKVLLKAVEELPADGSKTFEAERPALAKSLADQKLHREMWKRLDELKREARPEYHLTVPDAAKK
jgi:RNA polymerase sigma factor (sigma-70 family)